MAIEFLYFDLGGVLLSFSHDAMCQQMSDVAGIPVAVVRQALLGDAGGPSLQWRLERGDISVDGAYDHFCQHTGTRPDRTALYRAGSDIFGTIDETVALARRLQAAGQRLGILSNTNPFDWRFVTDGRYAFLNECFECYALSFEARAMKPEPAIYRRAAELAGVTPEKIFFTDDREENVAGARVAGFDAVVFESAAQLGRELQCRGVAYS